MRNKKGQAGFLLVDVLIAVAIISIALLSIGVLFSQSARAVQVGDNSSQAYSFAQQRIEELRAADKKAKEENVDKQPTEWEKRVPASQVTYMDMPNQAHLKDATPTKTVNNIYFTRTSQVRIANIDASNVNNVNSHLVQVLVTVNWVENSAPRSIAVAGFYERI